MMIVLIMAYALCGIFFFSGLSSSMSSSLRGTSICNIPPFNSQMRTCVISGLSGRMGDLYAEVMEYFYSQKKNGSQFKAQWLTKIDEVNKKLAKARDQLVNDDIEPSDFKQIKVECEEKINIYEAELSKAQAKEANNFWLFKKLSNTLINVDSFYS